MVFPEGEEIVRSLMEDLNIVGVLCVEFFYTKEGKTFDKRNGTKGA
jgi:5-(carboxyamino)imidazole ribonucleotide synthase